MFKRSVTRSWEYNALCDSCKRKFKASELRMRWDGLMVCKDDYEIRHPLDFFRNRNDQHKLPWTRSNDGNAGSDPRKSYVPTINNITYTQLDGETGTLIFAPTSPTAYYYVDALTGYTTMVVDLLFTKPSASDATISLPVLQAVSTTTGTVADITMPTVPTTAGSFTIINDRGEVVKTGSVPAGNITVTLGSWAAKRGGITISAKYGT